MSNKSQCEYSVMSAAKNHGLNDNTNGNPEYTEAQNHYVGSRKSSFASSTLSNRRPLESREN